MQKARQTVPPISVLPAKASRFLSCEFVSRFGCTPKGSYGNKRFQEGFWEGSGKGSGEGFSEGFWEGGPAMGFTVKQGSEKGSEKEVSRRCPEHPLGEYDPLGAHLIDCEWSGSKWQTISGCPQKDLRRKNHVFYRAGTTPISSKKTLREFGMKVWRPTNSESRSESRSESCSEMGFSHKLCCECHSESCSENAPEFRELLREWPSHSENVFFRNWGGSQVSDVTPSTPTLTPP